MIYKTEDIYSYEKVCLKFSNAVGMLTQPVEHEVNSMQPLKKQQVLWLFSMLISVLNFFSVKFLMYFWRNVSTGEKLGHIICTGLGEEWALEWDVHVYGFVCWIWPESSPRAIM